MAEEEKKEEEVKGNMVLRSTGLGATVLYADVTTVSVKDDLLVLHVQALKPVRWHIRAAITYKGILKLLWAVLSSASVLKFLVVGLFRLKNPRITEDF
jgi:hypothetical protein